MEIDVIREFMFDNINQMQESHSNGGPGAARKVRLLWEQLTEKVNAVGNGPRTVNQVKMKWNNMVLYQRYILLNLILNIFTVLYSIRFDKRTTLGRDALIPSPS